MPNPSRIPIDRGAPAPDGEPRPVQSQVVAHAVDTFVSPQVGQTQALMDSLSVLNPALKRYSAYKDLLDEEAGSAARTQGQQQDASQSTAWARGYMRMDGMVKGQADSSKLLDAYNQWDGKDGGDINTFISQQVGQMTQGMQNDAYHSGFNKALDPVITKLRATHLDYNREQVVARTESNAMTLLENGVRGYVAAGQPVPDDFINGYRDELGKVMGISNKDFNGLLFGAVKRTGDEGNYAIYDSLKKPRADGTPGMYFIPEWKQKIDAAQIHAQNVFLENQNKAHTLAKQQREDQIDSALLPTFLKAFSGDTEGARKDFEGYKAAGLFSRASDVLKWEKELLNTEKREATTSQQATETGVMTSIIERKAGVQDIINADLTSNQKKSLLSTYQSMQAADRANASAQRANMLAERRDARDAAGAIYKTPQYDQAKTLIKSQLMKQKGLLDSFTKDDEFQQAQLGTALSEFAQHASSLPPEQLMGAAHETIDRYLKRRAQLTSEQKEVPGAAMLQYSSPAEAAAAFRSGAMSPEDLALHSRIFRQLRSQPKANGK